MVRVDSLSRETIGYSLPDIAGIITLVDSQVAAHFWEDHPTRQKSSTEEAGSLVKMVRDYFAGRDVDPADWAVNLAGLPPFYVAVYRAVRGIPRGRIATYGEIAATVGSPGAARAVGNALAHNPMPLFVPCHRVKSQGGLGGWSGPTGWKERLLALESGAGSAPAQREKTGGRYR